MALRKSKGVDPAAVREAAAARGAGTDPRAVLNDLARIIGEGLGVQGCDVHRHDAGSNSLVAVATWPDSPEESWLGTVYALAEYPIMQRMTESRVSIQARTDRPGLSDSERRDLAMWGIRATMGVRLEVSGRLVGCMLVHDRKARDFDPGECDAFASCAAPVADALERVVSPGPGR